MAPHELAVSPEATASPFKLPLAVSFNYADRHEHIVVDTQYGSVVGSTDTSVYLGRFETYGGCSLAFDSSFTFDCPPEPAKDPVATVGLSVSALAGYADGHSLIGGIRADLDGPAVGAGATLLLYGPVVDVAPRARHSLEGTVFFTPGFDYLATNYSAIEGWVSAYNVRPRAGLLGTIDKRHRVSVYGGASWEDFTEKQTLSDDTRLTTRSRPRRPWTGLIGANYAYVLDQKRLRDVSLTIEGEVGERAGIALALRYAFSIPL